MVQHPYQAESPTQSYNNEPGGVDIEASANHFAEDIVLQNQSLNQNFEAGEYSNVM